MSQPNGNGSPQVVNGAKVTLNGQRAAHKGQLSSTPKDQLRKLRRAKKRKH